MIHVLRWLAIFGTLAFLWWVHQPDCRNYRKRTQRTFN